MSNNKENDKNSLFFFSLLLFLGAGAFLVLALNENRQIAKQKQEETLNPVDPDEVNFNLKSAHQQQLFNKLRVMEEVGRAEKEARKQVQPNPNPNESTVLSFESDVRNQVVQEALGHQNSEEKLILTPDEIVQTHLYEIQVMKQLDEAYKKDYAKKFIAYARSKGFAVKLDQNLKIISMRPIAKERTAMEYRQNFPAGKE